jgi:predicted alpha-1,2-mannosidase
MPSPLQHRPDVHDHVVAPAAYFGARPLHRHVDPWIGSEGLGNVFIGPSRPFGMVKPGPDNKGTANSGYIADAQAAIPGFSQLHVSGTGGGPKYGHVSVMPFTAAHRGAHDGIDQASARYAEVARLGYYATTLARGDIRVELTTAARVAFYRFTYAEMGADAPIPGVKIDAGAMLNEAGKQPPGTEPWFLAEPQHLVGSEIEVVSPTTLRGYGRMRGGWNFGAAYTVYFHVEFDRAFTQFSTWQGDQLHPGQPVQVDSGVSTGALLRFDAGAGRVLQMKVGISFISAAKARQNLQTETPRWHFDEVLADTQQAWEDLMGRVELGADTPEHDLRMFYTALYHTMLMPVDRTGENPLWNSDAPGQPPQPHYDDFYAIWDTFRSSHPLLTLLDPQRQANIVHALLDIYRHDGYLPDARSGLCNGRTQGGSHADVLIADAWVKGLKGIDYELGLQAMLKNADVPPGGNEQKEGRGGLPDYNTLGYVSTRYPRAGTRTMEYAHDDYAIAVLAKGLGHEALFERFSQQSDNWKRLWRDVESLGTRGFVMPRQADGSWLETLHCTVPGAAPRRYAPTDVDHGQCLPWWDSFLYEGSSWEYSLYVPHDVAGLIEQAGGAAAFRQRLDTFFDHKLYNVTNEPSFLSPTLYHWLGQPEASSERIRQIVREHYSDRRDGLPGNDDSGAMSSWLAFHMLGLYPNAAQSYYLVNTPLVTRSCLNLAEGRRFLIVAQGLSETRRHVQRAALNGRPFTRAWIEHSEIVAGGELVLEMGEQPVGWGRDQPPPSRRFC